MSAYPRMKRLYPTRPHVKKGQRQSESYKALQHNGTPGWILLTHDEEERARALFVDFHENVTSLSIILDERICCDTVLRAIRLSPTMYVVNDIRTFNGKNVHETLCFEDRQQMVTTLLELFHHSDLVALIPVDDVPDGTPIRGTEYYDNQPGSIGVFLPAEE